MNDSQTKWCNQIPSAYRGTYRKAMIGRKALAAIRAKCLDCQNWQVSEVRDCPMDHCPLWPYRKGRMARATNAGAQKTPEGLRVSATIS